MAKDNLPHPDEIPAGAAHWAGCLREALMIRREQEYRYPLRTAAEIQQMARLIRSTGGASMAADHPLAYRGLAALISMADPRALVALLAGVATTDEGA